MLASQMRRRALMLAASALVVAGPFVAGYLLSRPDRASGPVAAPSVVDEVREALAARYYRPVPADVLRLGSVDAMLSALRDPYTSYLDPPNYRMIQRETSAAYSGIGVGVLPTKSGLVVASVGRAARAAGVRAGDMIVGIGGRSAVGFDEARAVARIDDVHGPSVQLELSRAGRTLTVDVARGLVRAPTVLGRLLSYEGSRWGEVRLAAFRSSAARLVAREVRRLARKGAKGFVLDLRGDPGGFLDQAVSVSSVFLGHGVVVSLSGAHFVHQVFRARRGDVATRLPLVVLVDRYTASSAEIVAAALSEDGRATLVGERTFGKGVVQAVDPLDNGAALMLTVARYYTPDGSEIAHVGITPQVHAVDDPRTSGDEGLAAALHVLARPAS
jgi:carboxyl-terminal processing protease